jgi:hypothetical protein
MDHASRDFPLPTDQPELLMPADESPEMMQPETRGRLMERLVARAVPPNLGDIEQEHIAEEAAENAIRDVMRMAGIAVALLVVVAGALLYYSYASARSTTLTQASRIAAAEWENGKLRETNTTLQQKLDQAIKEQARLRGEAAAFHSQVDALTQQLQQARTLAAQKQKAKTTSPPAKSRSQAPTSTSANLRPQSTTAPKR